MKQTPDVATTNPVDRLFHVWLGRATMGLSPAALFLAYSDWFTHLAISPGKQTELVNKAVRKASRFALYGGKAMTDPDTPPCIEPLPQDRRFRHEGWQQPPFNLIYQSFLLLQQLWFNATTGIRGVSRHHEQAVSFAARQALDICSPSNFLPTNPEVLKTTLQEGGTNLFRGWLNLGEDWERILAGKGPAGAEAFRVGETLAVTPGKVVFRNRLIELIQYSPATDTVWREPLLMVPAWMMKYYIMDLSPHNSMVKYLVEAGHTVFMVSWKNPGPEDRDLDMEDYRILGLGAALDAVAAIVPGSRVHLVGYCLGGILATMAAATLARDGEEDRLSSLTLFTALTDFNEPGELGVFIDPSEVSYLEDIMWEKGFLEPNQAAGSFQLLRSNDLIWSKLVHEYWLGKRQPMFDLMAWNADGTRMPYRMHSELLRRLFLNNDLAEGRYRTAGRPIALADIHTPIFAVAAERDHVAPWRSVYKLHLQADADEVTFLLTSGGHNVGIVNEPGHPGRYFRMRTSSQSDRYVDPDTWETSTPKHEGSWWPAWEHWLSDCSTERVAPPPLGNGNRESRQYAPICDAPGSYVLEA
jgi:polyhydroxyalkanoate synthase